MAPLAWTMAIPLAGLLGALNVGCTKSSGGGQLERTQRANRANETAGREVADEAHGAGARVRRSPSLYQSNFADDVSYPPPTPRAPGPTAGGEAAPNCDRNALAERDRVRLVSIVPTCETAPGGALRAKGARAAPDEAIAVTVQAHIDRDGLVDAVAVNGGASPELAQCIEEQTRVLRFDPGCPRVVVAPLVSPVRTP
jgi:hypothetical protein